MSNQTEFYEMFGIKFYRDGKIELSEEAKSRGFVVMQRINGQYFLYTNASQDDQTYAGNFLGFFVMAKNNNGENMPLGIYQVGIRGGSFSLYGVFFDKSGEITDKKGCVVLEKKQKVCLWSKEGILAYMKEKV